MFHTWNWAFASLDQPVKTLEHLSQVSFPKPHFQSLRKNHSDVPVIQVNFKESSKLYRKSKEIYWWKGELYLYGVIWEEKKKVKIKLQKHTILSLDRTSWTTNLNSELVIKPVSAGCPPPCGWKIVESKINVCLPSSS